MTSPGPGRQAVTRESAQAKGARYIAEGRLNVVLLTADEIRATCRGDGATYRLGWNPGGWYCDCPALTRCAHLAALRSVTIRTADHHD